MEGYTTYAVGEDPCRFSRRAAPWNPGEDEMTDDLPKRQSGLTAEMLSAYGTMLLWLFIATFLLIALLSIPTVLAYQLKWKTYTMIYVVLAGALGGFISSLSRLYSLRELPALLLDPNLKLIRNGYVAMYALVPPLIGIVAAAVIYLAVAAGLVQGDLFAKFACAHGENQCDAGLGGLMDFGPATVRDNAKVLVWGFISGFSERLFPSVIEGLGKQDHP